MFSLNEDEDESKRLLKNKIYSNIFFFLDDSSATSQQQVTLGLIEIESMFTQNDIKYKYECEHFDEQDKKHAR